MKKFLAILIFTLFSLTAFSQTYPRIETDSIGQKVVIMTIKQAQVLDNNTDLLVLFEKLNGQLGSYDSICLKVIGEKDQIIASQTVQISDLKSSLITKDEKIKNLQIQIADQGKNILSLNTELTNKNKEIDLHLGEIRRVKIKYLLGGSFGGAVIGFIAGILLINH
jgi:hypothetical protein